ncbi:MAG TPA: MerR family transcriptional regulator [Opitutaceae bacterium]|jgi:hypothetical protein|nr:MerR family transcriptional regulator [Opitutaceae bacterium]
MKKKTTRKASGARASYTLKLASQMTGAEPELIRYYHVSGILHAAPKGGRSPLFDDDSIYELRRLEHYRRQLGANRQALALIGGLLREVARLEAELRFRGHA